MSAETTRLRVRVSPGAGRTALVGRHGDAWKVRVTEAPERGRANEAVLRLLAETLALPRTALTLVSGHGGREKIVELTGVGPALIERRLASATQAVRPGAGGLAGGASSQQPDRGRKERRWKASTPSGSATRSPPRGPQSRTRPSRTTPSHARGP